MRNEFTTGRIGPVELPNRFIRSAAFEGMGKDNGPTDALRDYHWSVAEGGVGMTTLAYAGVCRSALSFKTQLWLRPEISGELRDITDGIHARGAKASIQIGHCGNMTHRATAGCTPVGASTGFNLYSPTIVRGLRADELPGLARDFGEAVRTARQSGFDCVEVHAGHGYLISQFLSPYTNRRRDRFGGSLDNRMNFMRMVMEEVMKAAESDMGVIVKTNMSDGFKGGLGEEECLRVALELERLGVHAMVLSGGFVSRAPMYVMRGEMPLRTMTKDMPQWWLKAGVRAVGRFMIPTEDYRPLYFLEQALRFKKEIRTPLVYVGGVTRGEDVRKVMDEGFEFMQLGRALIRDPQFVGHLREDEAYDSGCDHVNYCVAKIYCGSMECYRKVQDLPAGIRKETEKLACKWK